MLAVKSVEDAARWLDQLPIARASTEFSGAAATLWVVCQLADVQRDALYQIACGSEVLQRDVVCDSFKISDGWLCPDHLSHLDRRFSVCA